MTNETKWTYDRPTAPGYYWAMIYSSPEVVLVDHIAGRSMVSILDEDMRELSECNGWQWFLEPIAPPPVPPEDEYGP